MSVQAWGLSSSLRYPGSIVSDTEQSVTAWFHAIKGGDEKAAHGLWNRYFDRITYLAKRRLVQDAAYDEEDLAASVMRSLYDMAKEDRYADLANRDELWALLIVVAKNKIIGRLRHTGAKKRGGEANVTGDPAALANLQTSELCPELNAEVHDECRNLIEMLGDESLQAIALRRLDGLTIDEIAADLDSSSRTVRRRLALIRKKWQQYEEDNNE